MYINDFVKNNQRQNKNYQCKSLKSSRYTRSRRSFNEQWKCQNNRKATESLSFFNNVLEFFSQDYVYVGYWKMTSNVDMHISSQNEDLVIIWKPRKQFFTLTLFNPFQLFLWNAPLPPSWSVHCGRVSVCNESSGIKAMMFLIYCR